jgi:hypothetical protein
MPVIRGQLPSNPLTKKRRAELIDKLMNELAGKGESIGPVIFEIPLDGMSQIDVLVVWDEWEPVRPEDRSAIILEAYKKQKVKVGLASGATHAEALEQDLLPYTITSNPPHGEKAAPDKLRVAKLAAGGIPVGGQIVLRFPTMSTAHTALQKLSELFPDGYWTIVRTAVHSD